MKIVLIVIVCIIAAVGALLLWSSRLTAKMNKERKELENKYELSKDKRRLLAYGAILALYRTESTRVLEIKSDREELRQGLASAWGISGRDDAIDILEWLINEGHRTRYNEVYAALKSGDPIVEEELGKSKSCYEEAKNVIKSKLNFTDEDFNAIETIAAWDYDRAINIARWSHALDYITEEEAWEYIEEAAKKASRTFLDWKYYYISFAFGRAIAYEGSIYDTVWEAKRELFEDPNSVWNEFPFRLSA